MKHNKPLVSIIITFYNEEDYLVRCLESVKNQTYENLEVILVNDGSSDDSLQIAESFKSCFKNIKILTIKNSGLSEARNYGLNIIKGEYVTFLDADDEFEKGMIDTCINKIIEERSDLVLCKFSIINKNGDLEFVSGWKDNLKDIKKTSELISEMFSFGISEAVWGKIYKSDIAKKIKFAKGTWFEDSPFLLEYLFLAYNVCYVNESLLKIHKRDSSITRRIIEVKRIVDFQRVFELEITILKKYQGECTLKNKIAKHYLDATVDNYLFQVVDKSKIVDLKNVRKFFQDALVIFKKTIREEKINFSIKDKLLLQFLGMHRFLGWNLSNQIFIFVKRKRIKAINKLR